MHLRLLTRKLARICAALAMLASLAASQTTWTGSVSSVWDVSGNWSAGIPDSSTSATIPAAVPNDPSTSGAASASCLDLDLQSGANLTVDASLALTIFGNADFQGSVAGTGDVTLAGPGTLTAAGSTSLPNLVIAAGLSDTVTLSGAVDVTGNLTLTSGILAFATSASATVGADATFAGGVLSGGVGSLLTVTGDVTFDDATSTAPPDITVAGNWTSDAGADFAAGLVTFNGTVTQTVSAADSVFFDFALAAGVEIDSAGLAIPIGGDITMAAGAEFSLVSVIKLVGATQTVEPGGPLPNVEVATPGSVNLRDGVTLDGSLSLLYGKMCIDNTAEVTVAGDGDFTGGTLTGGTIDSSLDIGGNVTWNGATANNPPMLNVGGDWSSNASFAPNNNVVEFEGGGTRDVFADDSVFFDVRVGAATLLDVSSARLALQGDLEVPPVGGFSAPSTVRFVGATQTVDPGGPLPNVEVAGLAVTFTGAPQAIEGALRLISGDMTIAAAAEVDVAGAATFEGGQLLSGGGGARLDLEGTCSFTGTTTTTPPDIDCAGDWTSDATFAPLAGTVTLDGSPDTSFGSFGPDFDPTFFVVHFTNGTRVVAHDLELNADTIRIVEGGEVDLDGNRVTIPGTIVDIEGKLDIGTAAELLLGGGVDMAVGPTGELSMIGVSAAPARIGGFNGGGYQLQIDGLVTACGFEFADPGPMGIAISRDARFSEAPYDLRNGTFTSPSPVPGSVLLDIDREDAATFSKIAFEDPFVVGSFNVKASAASAPITFLNFGGSFGGPQFVEPTTPSGTIEWIQGAQTQLASTFAANDGDGKNTLSWQTTLEVDAEVFLVEAGASPGGPWTLIGETPALGSGSSYAVDHFGPAAGQTCYRLSERLYHSGTVNPLAGDCAFPSTDPNPPNILTVSPFGNISSIDAALALAASGLTGPIVDIRVAGGTYPPFTLDGSQFPAGAIHIGALGNGKVIIDVSNGPVQIANVPFFTDVFVSDLTLVNDTFVPGAGPALTLDLCNGLVALDRVDIFGNGSTLSMSALDAQRLLVQSCTMTGGAPDMVLDGGTDAIVSKGIVDQLAALGRTRLRTCELGGSINVGGSATLQTFPGLMPRAAPEFSFLPVTLPFDVLVEGTPGTSPTVRIDFATDWFDSAKPKWEFVSLIPFPAAVEIPLPPFGAAPTVLPFFVPLAFQPQLLGFSLHIQPVTFNPIDSRIRFGHLSRMTFTL